MSAVKKLARKVIPKSAISAAEETYRINKAKTAYTLYGKAPKNLKVIAVTGTNGKTSTCAFINTMLKNAGLKTAVYTTAFTEVDGLYAANKTHMTVASPWSVQKFFKRAKSANVDWAIVEVTSHALDQYRIYGVPVSIAIITNLSQDHLDYHGTMENYAAAKARLITDYQPKDVILNADDEWFEYFGRQVKNNLLPVGKNSKYQIKGIELLPKGTKFNLVSPKGSVEVKMNQVGEFNVYNAAMAAAVGQVVGLSRENIADGLASLQVIEGRLEPVDAGQNFAVLVDYAHTPDALQNVIKAVKTVAKGKVRLVFGATGDRDKKKRQPMGQIAAELADYIYLTDDETYTEDPDAIRQEVEQGIKEFGSSNYEVIADRRDAIKKAFMDAKAGDIVLLCGIGHQDYRNMGGKHQPWDERIVAKEILQEIK